MTKEEIKSKLIELNPSFEQLDEYLQSDIIIYCSVFFTLGQIDGAKKFAEITDKVIHKTFNQ